MSATEPESLLKYEEKQRSLEQEKNSTSDMYVEPSVVEQEEGRAVSTFFCLLQALTRLAVGNSFKQGQKVVFKRQRLSAYASHHCSGKLFKAFHVFSLVLPSRFSPRQVAVVRGLGLSSLVA